MTSHVFTIVVDNPTVKKVLSKQTIVQKVIVGSSIDQINLPDAVPSSETVTVGPSSATKVISQQTLVDKIFIGNPPPNIHTTIKYGLDSADVFSLVDSDYVTSRFDVSSAGIDSSAVTALIDSDYINFRVDPAIDSSETINIINNYVDSDYINSRVDPAVDSSAVTAMIDSDYINSRVIEYIPNLTWTTQGDLRINTGWYEEGSSFVVRSANFNGDGLLQLELASFSPTVSASGQSLKWDQPASQWSVSVSNPDDFPSKYVSSVAPLLTNINGNIDAEVADYTTSGPSQTPAGTVDWNQTFSTNAVAEIYSSTTNHTGGSASATVQFLDEGDNTLSQTANISFNWGSVSNSISMSNLSGKTFLDNYTSTSYSVSVSGLLNNSNASSAVTASGGTVSNPSGSGTFTFDTPIHKNNNGGRTVSVSTDFTRPATVTGTSYVTTRTASDTSLSASFTYPSFHTFTVSTTNPPTRGDVVDGDGFSSSVTVLGNQSRTINQFITNSESTPRAFYFAVRSSATQPSTFQTGASASLLSDVAVTTGQTLLLEPDSPGAGYISEQYSLYGITLQPGQTYVSIN